MKKKIDANSAAPAPNISVTAPETETPAAIPGGEQRMPEGIRVKEVGFRSVANVGGKTETNISKSRHIPLHRDTLMIMTRDFLWIRTHLQKSGPPKRTIIPISNVAWMEPADDEAPRE